MEVIDIAKQMNQKIECLVKCRQQIGDAARKRAQTGAEYSKSVAKVAVMLRMGKAVDIDGEAIKDPPASIIERLAKGKCYQEEAAMLEADAMYKGLIESIRCLQAELNGLQSMFRHLDTT